MSCPTRLFASLVLSCAAATARADVYMAPFDRAEWRVTQSALSCRLQQQVPRYGKAIFETAAGRPQVFYVATEHNPMRRGVGQWVATAPAWNPDRVGHPLGGAVVGEGPRPVVLDDAQAQRLVSALRDGLVPELVQTAADGTAPVRLGLSPVNFRSAWERYQSCTGQLLPYSFEQVASTPIAFSRDRSDLDAAARRKIDLLVRYVVAERRETGRAPRIDIDALSDDTYRRIENLELSKLRAQAVHEYLVSRGIAADSIATHHRTVRGGGESRRSVTIRLRRAGKAAPTMAATD